MYRINKFIKTTLRRFLRYWQVSLWHKIWLVAVGLVILIILAFEGVAIWYIHSESSKPLKLGVTFVPDYASYFGLKPKKVMKELNSIGVKNYRLVSYWSDIEKSKGDYDFSQLDWQFAMAQKYGAKITLAIGLRQPRWPECHAPNWADINKNEATWLPELQSFIKKVVNRYKSSPSLKSYQLENEFFNDFGNCPNTDKTRLIKEFKLVKQLDPHHPIIMSRSNNFPSLVLGKPLPDKVGVSIYHKVWSGSFGGFYFTYPQPPHYYAGIAGLEKIFTGRDSIIHELQAEPWAPRGKPLTKVSLLEQNKTMNAKQLKSNVEFAKKTGMRDIYLFGASYWYYRKVKLNDSSVWNSAKAIFAQSK